MNIRPKKMPDIGKLKAGIVFGAGAGCGFGGAVTGIGPQNAYSPSLIWMLGYSPEKATGVGLRFAFWCQIVTLVVACYLFPPLFKGLPLDAFLIAWAATIGALIALPLGRNLTGEKSQIFGKVLGIVIGLVTMFLTVTKRPFSGDFGIAGPHWALMLGAGAISGALAQLLRLTPSIVLIPALYFGAGETPIRAILLAIACSTLASLLPLASYRTKGLTEGRFSTNGLVGGLIGSVLGSMALVWMARGSSKWSLVAFSLTAMFLLSREISILQNSKSSPED